MRYLALVVALLGTPAMGSQIIGAEAPAAVSVSSVAYVSVVSSSTRRSSYERIVVKNPSANVTLDEVFGHIGGCTSTAVSLTATKGPFSFNRGDIAQEIELAEERCLWVASTSTQTINVQAIARKR